MTWFNHKKIITIVFAIKCTLVAWKIEWKLKIVHITTIHNKLICFQGSSRSEEMYFKRDETVYLIIPTRQLYTLSVMLLQIKKIYCTQNNKDCQLNVWLKKGDLKRIPTHWSSSWSEVLAGAGCSILRSRFNSFIYKPKLTQLQHINLVIKLTTILLEQLCLCQLDSLIKTHILISCGIMANWKWRKSFHTFVLHNYSCIINNQNTTNA